MQQANPNLPQSPPTQDLRPRHVKPRSLFDSFHLKSIIVLNGHPIVLGHSDSQGYDCLLKVIPFEGGEPNDDFLNESRFMNLNHPNIIKYHEKSEKERYRFQGETQNASMLIMEYGTYFQFSELSKYKDEKLIRTFFRQLIEGIEYLHERGIAHMNLSTKALILGQDLKLKILDFEKAYVCGDEDLRGKGEKGFRAPELEEWVLVNPAMCDIYAAGIILFILWAGVLPYDEENLEDEKLEILMNKEDTQFWEIHEERSSMTFSTDFRNLFFQMVKFKPEERSLQKVKESDWYRGTVLNDEEITKWFENRL